MSAEEVFRKGSATAPPGYFRWEAAGLAWLAEAPGGAPVAEVLDQGEDHLDLRRLVFANPDPAAAEALGAGLARTHDAGAPAFGAAPAWSSNSSMRPSAPVIASTRRLRSRRLRGPSRVHTPHAASVRWSWNSRNVGFGSAVCAST